MQKSSDEKALLDEIVQALRAACSREEPVMLSPRDKPISLFSTVLEVTNDYAELANPIPPLMAPFILSAPSFQILLRSYWIRCSALTSHGRNLRVPLGEVGRIEMARSTDRVCFSEKENVRVKIRHPFDSATTLWRRVFDLSPGGMSFRAKLNTPFIQPNRLLPHLEIHQGGTLRESHQGRIVYVKQIIDARGQDYFQVGVQFCDDAKRDDDGSTGESIP